MKKKINYALLRKVKAQILKEPLQFKMLIWFSRIPNEGSTTIPNCGTAACIAGWGVSLALKLKPREAEIRKSDTETEAIKLFGVTERQSERLFYTARWPSPFREKHESALGKPTIRARIAAARIDHFIKTKGEE